jgi:hypothetical protein
MTRFLPPSSSFSTGSRFSDVREWADATTAILCRRCWAGDRKDDAIGANRPDYVRVWRAARLLLRGASKSRRECSPHQADIVSGPLAAWGALSRISELLPSPGNQVELMQIDSVSMPELPGLGALEIRPHSVEEILQEILRTH